MSKSIELVLNNEGAVYHLNLKPGQVAETIFLVGDPGRAILMSEFFDDIEFHTSNREINTFTGTYKGKRISVLSSGMGPDNIEIVVNELDALFNIDFETKLPKNEITSLNLIRIGTSGALREDIGVVDSFLASEYALGLDGLAYFYEDLRFVMEREMTASFINQMDWDKNLPRPYAIESSKLLLDKLAGDFRRGITLTAPGFYAPQGRKLRLDLSDDTIIDRAQTFKYGDHQVTNFEMETSALYALSAMLGHEALTVCNIIANRVTNEFSPDYRSSMNKLITHMLDAVVDI